MRTRPALISAEGTAFLFVLGALGVPAAADDAANKTEVLQFRDGSLKTAVIVAVTASSVTADLEGGGRVTIPAETLEPRTVHQLRSKRLAANDAPGWLDLAAWCRVNGLFTQAVAAYDRVAGLDPARKAEMETRVKETQDAEATSLLRRGDALLAEAKYDEAVKTLALLRERYPESAQTRASQALIAQAAGKLKDQNDEKRKRLDDAKKQEEQKKQAVVDAKVKDRYDVAVKKLEEARALHVSGLDEEGKTAVSRAIRNWEGAADKLLEAKVHLQTLQAETKDPAVLVAIADRLKEVDGWQILVWNSLGNIYAVQINFADAVRWLNKTLALDPTNRIATELKLHIAAASIRRNVVPGSGY